MTFSQLGGFKGHDDRRYWPYFHVPLEFLADFGCYFGKFGCLLCEFVFGCYLIMMARGGLPNER